MARDDTVLALSYAVRLPVVLKYLGQLSLVLAILTLPPLLAALWFQDYVFAWRLLSLIVLTGAVGAMLSRLPTPARLQVNEALVITALAFAGTAVLMTWPLMAAGIGFSAALFEAVSAVTTTGLSTLATVEDMPPAFLFTRAWMQWYGGLGIVVLTVALLLGHSLASHHLVDPELRAENIATTTRHYARRMLQVYVLLTLGGLMLLLWVNIDLFTALTHVFAAVSTGGFSNFDASLAALPAAAQLVVSLLCVTGAVALPLYYAGFMCGPAEALRDMELRALVVLSLVMGVAMAWLLAADGMPWHDALWHGLLLGISAQTTAGFFSLDLTGIAAGGQLLLILAMLGGGSLGSTAGGVKLLRLLILARLLQMTLWRSRLAEHAVLQPRLGTRLLESDDIERALLLILLFLLVVIASWLPFVLLGYEPLAALFEVVSAIGTVGLSSGLSASGLPPLLQAVLCFDMLAGRVEIVALLVLLFPGTWLGKRAEVS
ncbi:TrkH family potassium uptake protein [Sulfurivermis fontis]|uniref:TrkH family potassium uptake protein n=1 Tax=Sulfurivermis fontis TaxID=1972068 RepID=UPI001E2BB10B|nr:potassium transporter TrkG [Sulfurivermis fontis]